MKWMIWGLIAALVLIAAGILFSGSKDTPTISGNEQAAELCAKGTEDLNAFRLRDAREKLTRALELDPSLAEASISRAYVLARLGLYEDYEKEVVIADSLAAAIDDPDRKMMAQLRLSTNMHSRFSSMRDSLLERLSREKPDDIFVLVALASRADGKGDREETAQFYRRILEVDPNYAAAYNMLGYMAMNNGNYEQAIEHMQKYAFLAPDQANPHDSLGDVLRVLGRYEEAEKEYRQSLTIQPDFFHSLINLGRVYLARGQLKVGLDILEKVRAEVAGTQIERDVDREILQTYLNANMDEQLARTTNSFIQRYPEDPATGVYRSVRLAYMGKFDEGNALMDSVLADWRMGDPYKDYSQTRLRVERTSKRFAAMVADLADPPATRIRLWQDLVQLVSDRVPFHDQWFDRYMLAVALQEGDRPTEALEVLRPMLATNGRLIYPLILAVKCELSLGEAEGARKLFAQLEWCLSRADEDLPAKQEAAELGKKVAEMETG